MILSQRLELQTEELLRGLWGAPQGSYLRPLLFWYIISIFDNSYQKYGYYFYLDDISISYQKKALEKLKMFSLKKISTLCDLKKKSQHSAIWFIDKKLMQDLTLYNKWSFPLRISSVNAGAHLGFSEGRGPNLRKGANQHKTKKKRI